MSAPHTSAPNPLASGAGIVTLAGLCVLWFARKRLQHIHVLALFAVALSLGTVGALSGCSGGNSATTSTAVTNQLAVSSSTAAYGSAVTLTSTISTVANTATPSGTVLFYDGSTPLGSAAVSSGKAQLTVSTLAVGKHSITASYSGDTTFMPSISGATNVSITLATTLNVTVSDTNGNKSQLALPVSIH